MTERKPEGRAARQGSSVANRAAAAACVLLAGASTYLAGVFDSTVIKDIRTSSVYVENGAKVDDAAAEAIVGNRQLVLVYLATELGERGGEICDDATYVADGSVVVVIGNDAATYPCALTPGYDDEGDGFGRAYTVESVIVRGVSQLSEDLSQTPKAIVANYDSLVAADFVSAEARVIRPAFARLLLAGVALGALAIGALMIHLQSRRAGQRLAERAQHRAASIGLAGERDVLLASVAGRILELDPAYAKLAERAKNDTSAQARLRKGYPRILEKYRSLRDRIDADGTPTDDELTVQVAEAARLRDDAFRLQKP